MGSFSLLWKVTHTHSIYKRWLRYFVLQKAFLAYSSARRKFLKKHLWNSLCLKKDQVQAFPIKHLLCMSLMFNKEQSWINRKRDRETGMVTDEERAHLNLKDEYVLPRFLTPSSTAPDSLIWRLCVRHQPGARGTRAWWAAGSFKKSLACWQDNQTWLNAKGERNRCDLQGGDGRRRR